MDEAWLHTSMLQQFNKSFLPNYTLKKDAYKKIILVIIAIIALISSIIIANYYSNIVTVNH